MRGLFTGLALLGIAFLGTRDPTSPVGPTNPSLGYSAAVYLMAQASLTAALVAVSTDGK